MDENAIAEWERAFREKRRLKESDPVPVTLRSDMLQPDQARNLDMQRYADPKVVRRLGPAPKSGAQASSATARVPQVDTQLPLQGPLYRDYGRPTYRTYGGKTVQQRQEGQYGRQSTIAKIEKIAEAFAGQNPMSIYVGGISKKGGGYFPEHSSHRKGTQVDIRPVHNLGVNERVTWKSPNYNQAATMVLIHEIRRQHPNAVILFNDPKFVEMGLTSPYKGHDDHMHVDFKEDQGR